MINQIFNELKENIVSIYGSNTITVSNYLHHSLNYPQVQDFYKTYKTDIQKLGLNLMQYMNQNEFKMQNKAPAQKNNFRRNFSSEFIINGQRFNLFDGIQSDENLNENIIYQTDELNNIFLKSQAFELKKLQKKMQITGETPTSSDISYESFIRALIEYSRSQNKIQYIIQILKDANFDLEKFIKDEDSGKGYTKPVIEELCTNLNQLAQEGKLSEAIGRDEEINQVINILSKARKNNPILTGKAGVGKTAIAEGLAMRIVKGDVPDSLKNAIIYNLETVNIVKGTGFRGQFEQKVSELLEDFKQKEESGQMPILFIDELHTIMGAGSAGQGGLDFANIIKPALARGELRTIGATTTDEWYQFIKENSALDRRFVPVVVDEPSKDLAIEIIEKSLKLYENKFQLTYEKGCVEKAVDLSQQFIVDNALPDKAFDLIDFAGAMVSTTSNKKTVSIEDIEFAIAKQKKINLDIILESRKKDLKPVAPQLKKFIFGQDMAIEKISKAIERVYAGLNNKNKPYGAFLLTGPTGSGKTELAKQLANIMKANFHRIDMSEFMEKHSISKLIGSPAGYVGYDDGSSLTKIINQNPRTVLLLDEIEKAHPDIFNILLQAMDYGKITDSKGKEINFKNVIIVMTSNVTVDKNGSKTIGFLNNDQNANKKTKLVNNTFTPEFLGRLTTNGNIEFNALTPDIFKLIINKNINEINTEYLADKKLKLELDNKVIDLITNHGIKQNLGARPIRDFIEEKILDQLSSKLLFGEFKDLKELKIVCVSEKDGLVTID